ncbi:MAG: DMT family transporter [Bryobacteraceae bacterium]|nr:DMT family transporter [Bryobacteraceae bacterium]
MSRGDAHTRRPSPFELYGLIALMVFVWALNFIVGKYALRDFDPLSLACLRTTLAGVLILPLYLAKTRGRKRSWGRGDLPALIMLGVFGVALNQIFFVFGLNRTSVAHAAIVIGLTPIIVLSLAALRGLEKFTLRKVLGMAVAVAGVAALQKNGGSGATFTGDMLILLAAVAFSVFTVFGKESTSVHGSVTVNTFAYVGGSLLLAPLTYVSARGFLFEQVTAAGWLSLLYMAVFPSVVAYLIYYWALAWIPASRLSAFSYLQPLLATLMAIPLLGEQVTLSLMIGGALVLAGVWLTERG